MQRRQIIKQFKLFPTLFISIMAVFMISDSYLSAAETFWDDFDSSGYYDSVHHWGENPVVPTLDLTEFNTFKVFRSDDSVQWYWDPDQIRGQDLYPDILIDETSFAIPDEPLTLRMNFWASTSDWPLAWDSNMQPASNSADDIVCYYDVDYIRAMRIPAPANVVLVALGLLSLRYTRRFRH